MVVDHDERTDAIFHALSDATRRDIALVAMGQEHSVSSLARRYPMSVTAVQKHVNVLERAGLVTKERRGREQLVRGDIEAVREAFTVLERLEAVWRARLERFGDVLTEINRESHPTPRRTDMTVIDVRKDLTARTMTITAEFDAPVEQVWRMWADPRLLERWWGPPTYPATFVEHDLTPGSRITYFMTSPEGDRYHGYWTITSVDAPKGLSFDDGFADADGNPNDAMPTSAIEVRIDEHGDRTRMSIETTFASTEAMDQLLSMGMEEGMALAMGQIDELLVSA